MIYDEYMYICVSCLLFNILFSCIYFEFVKLNNSIY